ncbi:MAG: hypothetical protein HW374_671 [Bacteroidetes bacterium]|nr:hypothetical protein [Bacteroidota bacterium]
MKSGKFWMAVVAAGVAASVIDFVLHGLILSGAYYVKLTDLFVQEGSPTFFVLGDFVAMLVLAFVYDKVSASFEKGWKGGALFGAYAGLLITFPGAIFYHLMFKGFPYSLSWIWIVTGVIAYAINGAVLAAVYKKGEGTV